MEGVGALQRVVDRLFEWFGEVPRSEVERILREEVLQYQHRLRVGQPGIAAEHAAYLRLRELTERDVG